jgi:hypothetical protein
VKVSVAFDPWHIVAVPLMLAVGRGFTVMLADPVRLGLGAVTEHVVAVLVTLTMVYDAFAAGDTGTIAPFEIPFALKLVVPSVYTTLYVPAGKVNVRFELPPMHIVAVPLMLAVGEGFTVMVMV